LGGNSDHETLTPWQGKLRINDIDHDAEAAEIGKQANQ
jgi:hypothetical protein